MIVKNIGEKIYIFDQLTSTMDKAKEMVANGIDDGTVIMAKKQTNGRGSNNREWISDGNDALFSIVLDLSTSKISLIPIITAYSILLTLEAHMNKKINIKWPNDVLVDEKKISGVLIENFIQGGVSKTILGVGININSSHSGSQNFIYPSTSLMEILNKKIDVLLIVDQFLNNFNLLYKNLFLDKINLEKISEKLYGTGKIIDFRTNYSTDENMSENNKYKILGLNSDGTLRVSNSKKEILSLSYSEISS
ncbi:MAG: biotin--[acetyl-CoA-carboxylase] ligase [Dehalococcoidia bacterium]|nr:biotin--[acetyl-CoA-carboxylase] ligase [Dehalococcoidia bacterium]